MAGTEYKQCFSCKETKQADFMLKTATNKVICLGCASGYGQEEWKEYSDNLKDLNALWSETK